MNSTRNNSTRLITAGLNTTSSNNSNRADALNPHANFNNATLTRLREKANASKLANATLSNSSGPLNSGLDNIPFLPSGFRVGENQYQINSTQEVNSGVQLKLLTSSLNVSLNDLGLPECESIGPEVYSNKWCYAGEGMDRDDWNTLLTVNGCDNTTTLSDQLKDIFDDVCNSIPDSYFQEQTFNNRMETMLGVSMGLIILLCCCACLRVRRQVYSAVPGEDDNQPQQQPTDGYTPLCGGDDCLPQASYRP